jgi:hypothetical protein
MHIVGAYLTYWTWETVHSLLSLSFTIATETNSKHLYIRILQLILFFSYVYIWTPTLRCCPGGGVVVDNVLIDLNWLNRRRRRTRTTHRYCFFRMTDRDFYSLFFCHDQLSKFPFFFLFSCSSMERKWNINSNGNFSIRKIKKHIMLFKRRLKEKEKERVKESRRVARDHLSLVLHCIHLLSLDHVICSHSNLSIIYLMFIFILFVVLYYLFIHFYCNCQWLGERG